MNFIIAGICSMIFLYTLTICYKMIKELLFRPDLVLVFLINSRVMFMLNGKKSNRKTKSEVDIEESIPSTTDTTSFEKDEEMTNAEF